MTNMTNLFAQILQQQRDNARQDQIDALDRQRAEAYTRQVGLQASNQEAEALAAREKQARDWLAGAYDYVKKGKPEEFALRTRSAIKYGKAKGYLDPSLPDELTDPAMLDAFAMEHGVIPPAEPVPFDQTPEGMKIAAQSAAALKLENTRSANARALVRDKASVAKPTGATTPGNRTDVNPKPPTVAQQKLDQAARLNLTKIDGIDRRLTRLDSALSQIEKLPLVNTGPLDQYAVGKMEVGQEVAAAAEAIRPLLTALTRVPGVGSQSDLEARLDSLQYPSLDKAPGVNRRTMQELRAFVSDLRAAYLNQGESQDEIIENASVVGQSPDVYMPNNPAAAKKKRIRVDAEGNVIGN